LNRLVLIPGIAFWRFKSPFGTSTPTMGVHLGMWRFIPSHSFAFPGARDVTHGLPSWLATLQALALVVSPRLQLWQKQWIRLILFNWRLNNIAQKFTNTISKSIYSTSKLETTNYTRWTKAWQQWFQVWVPSYVMFLSKIKVSYLQKLGYLILKMV
jgi:hypothetical protein